MIKINLIFRNYAETVQTLGLSPSQARKSHWRKHKPYATLNIPSWHHGNIENTAFQARKVLRLGGFLVSSVVDYDG